MGWTPATYNITSQQYATFDETWTLKDENGDPFNLTGYTAQLQVRESYSSTSTLFSLSSGSGITLGGALGTVVISIAATVTDDVAPGNYVYDFLLTSGSTTRRWLQGKWIHTSGVTHG